jgi:hypothetical protein
MKQVKKFTPLVVWRNVVNHAGGLELNLENPYFIIAGQKSNGDIELNPNNIVSGSQDEKLLDLLSAESDFFTRLNFFANSNLHRSCMRTGSTVIAVGIQQVQVVEYFDTE